MQSNKVSASFSVKMPAVIGSLRPPGQGASCIWGGVNELPRLGVTGTAAGASSGFGFKIVLKKEFRRFSRLMSFAGKKSSSFRSGSSSSSSTSMLRDSLLDDA